MAIARGRRWPIFERWALLSLTPLAALAATAPLAAQSLDPQLLRSLQSQLGVDDGLLGQMAGDSGGAVPSDGDSSQESPGGLGLSAGRTETAEEQEVRRALARQRLADIYRPSEVERDYRQRLKQPQLRQFGYEFFVGAPPPTGSRAGSIGDDYVLGIGDEVQISLRGATNRSQTVRVDRPGF